MKNNIKLLFMLILILCLCMGCSNAYEDATSKEATSNDNEETTKENIKITEYAGSPLYNYIIRNGVEKKGVAVNNIEYNGSPIKLSFDYTYMNTDNTSVEIDEVFFVIVNGELCMTELASGTKDYVHYRKSLINQKTNIDFYIYPHRLDENSINDIIICKVPIGKDTEQYGRGNMNNIKYGGTMFHRQIVSNVSLTGDVEYETDNVMIDSFENIYGKSIEEMMASQEHEYVNKQQLMFKTEEGYMYTCVPIIYANMSRVEECSRYTLLFCDGKLFNGFDGKCMLSWTTESDKLSHKLIDVSSLEKGTHEIYVISVNALNNDIEYSDVYTIEVE